MFALLPHRILSAALILSVLVVMTCITLATARPGLGLLLAPGDEGVIVATRYSEPARAALQDGERIIALRVAGAPDRPLQTADLTPEPDMAFLSYAAMDAFFSSQDELHRLLQHDTLQLVRTDGSVVDLPLQPSRPLSQLPVVFWFQLFCAVGGLLAGAGVWAFRREDPATRYYALTGLGMLMFASAAAVYSTRELALPGTLFMALSALNQFGALLFCGGLIAVLWYYPLRLARFPAGPLIIAVYVALGAAIPLRLIDSVDLLAHLPISLGYLSTYLLAAVQWWKTRGDPVQRAALRVFLLAWLFGSGAFVAVMYLPSLAGIDNGAIQGYAFGFFLLIHVGVAFGVLRYQLFRLDRWWFTAWRLFFGGLAVIALDSLLVYLLRIDAGTSMLISLAIAGWIYFPLRQWLWSRLARSRVRDQPPVLIRRVTDALSGPEHGTSSAWKTLLQDAYAPLEIDTAATVQRDGILDNGLALGIAAHTEVEAMVLRYCEGGARLFQQKDIAVLAELRRLFAEILRYRAMLEEGVREERDRVARDLHDDVGARLLTMSHRLPAAEADQARIALSELRAVVYSMRAPPICLPALLGDWQWEVTERCNAAAANLDWRVSGAMPELDLAGGDALALSRILREALSNALRHAGPEMLSIQLDFVETALAIEIRHRHSGRAPDQWQASLGLHNLRDRLAKLGGDITWTGDGADLVTRWRVDLGTFGVRS